MRETKQTLNAQRSTPNAQFSSIVILNRPFDSLRSLRTGSGGEGSHPLALQNHFPLQNNHNTTDDRVTLAQLNVERWALDVGRFPLPQK
jgi:hypothetical protein